MKLIGIILKSGMPTDSPNPKERVQAGAYMRVTPARYAELVPRFAHDAARHLAAEKERREAFAETAEGKAAIKLQKDAQEARRSRAKRVTDARAKAIADAAAAGKAEARERLEAMIKREKDAAAAEKQRAAAAKKAADKEDGNK